jgi:hypothetical protein
MGWRDGASGEQAVSLPGLVLLDGRQHRGAETSPPPWLWLSLKLLGVKQSGAMLT